MCTWWVGKRRNKFRYPARVMLCVRPTKGQQHDTLAYTVLVPMTVICDMLANNIELINENFKVLRLRASLEGGAMQGKWRRPWQRVLLTSPSSNTIKHSEAQHLNLNTWMNFFLKGLIKSSVTASILRSNIRFWRVFRTRDHEPAAPCSKLDI